MSWVFYYYFAITIASTLLAVANAGMPRPPWPNGGSLVVFLVVMWSMAAPTLWALS